VTSWYLHFPPKELVVLSIDRRKQIAEFLRLRRSRLQPADVGLPNGKRRRTPGLRREEVAGLADVSTEWYKWLEQARDVRASAETLQRIAGALRLEPGESRHLLTLAGYGIEQDTAGRRRGVVGAHIQRLMDHLEVCPAWVYGERWDMLAWNRAATVIHGDVAELPEIERNTIHQMFVNPRYRQTLMNWERHAKGLVGKLRAAHARYLEDPWFDELIQTLCTRSPEFAAYWADHSIEPYQDGVKCYEHPEAGRLTFDYTVLAVSDERFASLNMVAYVPAPHTDTREKMRAMLRQWTG